MTFKSQQREQIQAIHILIFRTMFNNSLAIYLETYFKINSYALNNMFRNIFSIGFRSASVFKISSELLYIKV